MTLPDTQGEGIETCAFILFFLLVLSHLPYTTTQEPDCIVVSRGRYHN